MSRMTPAEMETFLDRPLHGIVGTVALDGGPQLSPIWYLYEGQRLYFGIGREHPLTLEEIGQRFNLTRERVRQIKEKALRKLRQKHRREELQMHVG